MLTQELKLSIDEVFAEKVLRDVQEIWMKQMFYFFLFSLLQLFH